MNNINAPQAGILPISAKPPLFYKSDNSDYKNNIEEGVREKNWGIYPRLPPHGVRNGESYSLRKGSRKDICPGCGKKTFTPYVDLTGTPLSPEVGICDRKNKCNYHYPPGRFFKDHPYLSRRGGMFFTDRSKFRSSRYRFRYNSSGRESYPEPSYIEPEIVDATLTCQSRNTLVTFLDSVFSKHGLEMFMKKTLRLYCMGSARKFGGSPVFWLIDEYGRVRDGKIMGYDPESGKRIKKPFPLFTNAHTLLEKSGKISVGNYRQCFFGSHLVSVKGFEDHPIWVFESEKAALIVATVLFAGGCLLGLPVASGGCANLTATSEAKKDPYQRIQLLRNRKVVLFPDQGKYEEWLLKGERLRGFASEVFVSTVMERGLHPYEIMCEIKEGDGLDDLILRYLSDITDTSDALDSISNLLLTSF